MLVSPLVHMKLRTAALPTSLAATFGKVREWDQTQHEYKKFHQGWDLEAPIGTPCRAIADGIIHYVGHHPDFGSQVILRFSKSGATSFSRSRATRSSHSMRIFRWYSSKLVKKS